LIKKILIKKNFDHRFIKHINREKYELIKKHWILIKEQVDFEISLGKDSFDKEEIRSFYNNTREIFYDDFYKAKFVIKSGDIVVDLGANIGLFSIYVKELYPKTKIYAFEPEKRNFELLKRNMKKYKETYLYKKAVGDKNKKEDLILSRSYLSHSLKDSFYKYWDNTLLTEKVDVVTLDKIIKNRIDVIKIDVEGYEEKAITGAENIIKTYSPLLLVAIEHFKEQKKNIINILNKINPCYDNILLNNYVICFYLPEKHKNRINRLKDSN